MTTSATLGYALMEDENEFSHLSTRLKDKWENQKGDKDKVGIGMDGFC